MNIHGALHFEHIWLDVGGMGGYEADYDYESTSNDIKAQGRDNKINKIINLNVCVHLCLHGHKKKPLVWNMKASATTKEDFQVYRWKKVIDLLLKLSL